MQIILPKIAIVMKGRPDKDNKKLLYLRYAVGGKSYWISLKISVAESSWDANKKCVKSKAIDAAKINQYINAVKFEAETLCFDWCSKNRGKSLAFEQFKFLFLGKEEEKHAGATPVGEILHILQEMSDEQLISTASYKTYSVAVKNFIKYNLAQHIEDINASVIAAYRRQLVQSKNANLAAQYCRSLKISFRHTVKRLQLKNITDPFTEKVKVVRLSGKKILTAKEYKQLVEGFKSSKGLDREILRRFIVLCKGVRYSDSTHLKKSDLQEFRHEGEVIHFFNRPAQKSGIAGMIVFYKEEDLLSFDSEGRLFEPMGITNYNTELKRVSLKIIGREITSHYGRHYAGDSAINSDFDIDDVKAILGISNESTARIYAQRQNTQILTKLLKYEKNKKDTVDG